MGISISFNHIMILELEQILLTQHLANNKMNVLLSYNIDLQSFA